MLHEDRIASILIGADQIQQRVRELGLEIARDYADRVPHVVAVLKGSVLVVADLIRAIDRPLTLDFMAVGSYGPGTGSTGVVRLIKDLDEDVGGRDVLVVEDVIDTGLTLSYILDMLGRRGPASIAVATLLSKPARRRVAVPIHYVGFEIPDAFVVGYGLDLDQRYRNLPYIAVIKQDAARETAPPVEEVATGTHE